jgi:cell division protein FtsL
LPARKAGILPERVSKKSYYRLKARNKFFLSNYSKNKSRHQKNMNELNRQEIKNKNHFTKWIRYEWILKNLLFFLFVALLAVFYIANGHMADNTIRDITVTANEVKELKYEYKSLKSEEMFKSRETQIVQAAAPLGLKISNVPPTRLVIKEEANDQ